MKNKKMHFSLFLAIVMVFCFGFSTSAVTTFAADVIEFDTEWHGLFDGGELSSEIHGNRREQGQRLISVFNYAIAELQHYASPNLTTDESPLITDNSTQIVSEPVFLSISRIVELNDFDNNIYTLVELSPYGYMIYHNDSGVFAERSHNMNSPYADIFGDLYYGGFSQYFVRTDNNQFMCLLTENTECATVVIENDWASYSSNLNDNLMVNADYAILDFVINGVTTESINSTNSPTAWQSASGWEFIQRQTVQQTGANEPNKGHCGFVALSILIGYFDNVSANQSMGLINGSASPRHVTNRHTNSALVTEDFVEALRVVGDTIGVGRHTLTTTQARNVARRYFQDRNVWNKINDVLDINALTTTNAKIRSNINAHRPVFLFANGLPGSDGKTGGHFVVGYATRNEGNGSFTVRVNYGWGNSTQISGGAAVGTRTANDVWITGFSWSGMLTFTITP